MAEWTQKWTDRGLFAEALAADPERALKANLLLEQVGKIGALARDAKRYDELQKTQLIESSSAVTVRVDDISAVRAFETRLRDLVPAVVLDLSKAGDKASATFLARLGFDRYRYRELAKAAEGTLSDADAAAVAKLERVERRDMPSRMDAFATFCSVLLAPERKAIVDRLEARRLLPTELASARDAAKRLYEGGKNVMTPAQATAAESEAVEALEELWSANRRLLRSAARGSATLEHLWTKC